MVGLVNLHSSQWGTQYAQKDENLAGLVRKGNKMIVDQIFKILEDEHDPVFGIGSAAVMANKKPGQRPDDLLPGAQSLICFGIPVPLEVYQMPSHELETAWCSQNLNNRRLDTLSIRLVALLEVNDERVVPIFGCMPQDENQKGAVVGYINQVRMGEVTGVGGIGKYGLLLNSRFGSRLMLGNLLTTAELPTICYPETDEPGCSPDCQICADVCPVDAIMP
jgi:epoxyqueuosine reductase QueG